MPSDPFLPPLTIRIRQHAFQFPRRFTPGHVLSESESDALNGLFAENVRNNVDGWVIDRLETGQVRVLGAEDMTDLQAKIEQYAAGYQFGYRGRTGGRESPFEVEVRAVALERALELAQAEGYEPEHPKVDEWVEEGLGHIAVQAEARRRVEVKARIASSALSEL